MLRLANKALELPDQRMLLGVVLGLACSHKNASDQGPSFLTGATLQCDSATVACRPGSPDAVTSCQAGAILPLISRAAEHLPGHAEHG